MSTPACKRGRSNQYQSALTSQTVNFIPCTGGTIYVQLAAEVNGSFQPASDYSYACKSAIGDFNGDGLQDLLWQNNTTGQVNVNYYGGAGPQPQGSAVLNNGWDLAGWRLVGAAEFDGSGTPDLVYQNTQTRQVNVNYYGGAGRPPSSVGPASVVASKPPTGRLRRLPTLTATSRRIWSTRTRRPIK